ncbi:hypothetical protein FNV43_RR17602 [Rhamnella rubrinervis]|uniref:Uncharacterized protein n=1 Tax=Rhamnella rubrinervis TaxID=2594499 RepID=A0A8K0DXU6_9ROSA|nr:hypothetical protein FNV43_RR17602 [Rhamnella rubrinervis]
MSIEALAMAGVSYVECGIDLQVLEHGGLEWPPLYLLAEKNVSSEVDVGGGEALQVDEEMKAKIRKWVKAVVSKDEIASKMNEERCKRKNIRNKN